jgi:ElaB/YqjD/DUF883 family membrane-anchored ribosome-binding protein
MSEDVFRIVVTVAVALACIAFLVQSFVVLGLYMAIRKMQAKVEPLIERAEPLIAKVGPVVDSAKPLIEKASATVEKAGVVVEKAGPILDNVRKIIEDNRPRVAEVSAETVELAKSARKHVERVGGLIDEAGERAKERIAQIDESVEQTVDQVGQVGDAMKRAVMKPVREVNGIAAGVSAAVSTIVHGSRRPNVVSATQDEEMFI